VTLASGSHGGRVLLHVSDTGPGIPADDLPHVFERLYRGGTRRRAPEGAGLGLAITASLVHAMGGTIEVSAVEGAGTTFTVALEAAQVAELATA
jgi:two-component system, OmpR family, sensor kinase